MTPKQKYDERKRLRAERLLREEQRAHDGFQREEDAEARLSRLMISFERIADVLELWADKPTVDMSMQTPEMVREWFEGVKDEMIDADTSASQGILDNVRPELCGYAIALFAAYGGD